MKKNTSVQSKSLAILVPCMSLLIPWTAADPAQDTTHDPGFMLDFFQRFPDLQKLDALTTQAETRQTTAETRSPYGGKTIIMHVRISIEQVLIILFPLCWSHHISFHNSLPPNYKMYFLIIQTRKDLGIFVSFLTS